MVEFQKKRWFSEDFILKNTTLMDQLTEVFLHNDIVGYTESCLMMGNMDLRKELSMIKVPTQILVGSDDQATPITMAEELNQLIPNSTVEIIDSAKHLASIEKPLVVVGHLLNLMKIN
jgi:3-oxoadipate enol-lactonase